MQEGLPEPNSPEEEPLVTEAEIQRGLSNTWWKTVQEIIPGKLRDVSKTELTPEELSIYTTAYREISKMVSSGVVEVSFRSENIESSGEEMTHQQLNRPQFRLKNSGGKTKRADENNFGESFAVEGIG